MKKFLVFVFLMVVGAAILVSSCDSGSSGGGGGDPANPADIVGTWFCIDSAESDAMLFDFTTTGFTRIGYENTVDDMVQVEGDRGTYILVEGAFAGLITQEWDDEDLDWGAAPSGLNATFLIDGDVLTIQIETHDDLILQRKTFTKPATIADLTWHTSGTDELIFNSDGSYTYEDTDSGYSVEGTWSATSNLFRTITTHDSDMGDFYLDNIYDYVIEGDELILTWKGTDKFTYTVTP